MHGRLVTSGCCTSVVILYLGRIWSEAAGSRVAFSDADDIVAVMLAMLAVQQYRSRGICCCPQEIVSGAMRQLHSEFESGMVGIEDGS